MIETEDQAVERLKKDLNHHKSLAKYHSGRAENIEAQLSMITNRKKAELNKKHEERMRERNSSYLNKSEKVYTILKQLGKPVGSDVISEHLNKTERVTKYNSTMFAAYFMSSLKSDPRIRLTKINGSKFIYGLTEWV